MLAASNFLLCVTRYYGDGQAVRHLDWIVLDCATHVLFEIRARGAGELV